MKLSRALSPRVPTAALPKEDGAGSPARRRKRCAAVEVTSPVHSCTGETLSGPPGPPSPSAQPGPHSALPQGLPPPRGPSGTGPTAATWSRRLPSPPGPGSRGLPQGRARWEGCLRPGRPAQSPTAPRGPRVGRGGGTALRLPGERRPPPQPGPPEPPPRAPQTMEPAPPAYSPLPARRTPPARPAAAVPRALPSGTGRYRARGAGPRPGGTGAAEAQSGRRRAAGRGESERPALPGPFPVPERGHSPPRAAAAGKAGGRRCRRHPAGPEGVKRKGRAGPSHSLAGRFVSSRRRRRRGAEQAAPARPPQGALRRRRARGAAPQPSSGGTHDAQHVIRRAAKWPPPGPRRATAPSGFGQRDAAFLSGSLGAAVALKVSRDRGRTGVAGAAARPSSRLRQLELRSSVGGGCGGTRTRCRPGRVGGSAACRAGGRR